MKKITIAILLLIFGVISEAQNFTVGTINYSVTSPSPLTVAVAGGPSATGDLVIPATVDNNGNTYAVTSISNFAFDGNHLTGVTIPDGVISIGNDAFVSNRLTSVNIPPSVTSIGDLAFQANNLTSVTISSGVTSIGSSAFALNSLTSIIIPSGITTIESRTFDGNQLTSISMPGVTSIEEGAFANNALTSFAIPSGVINIGDRVFESNQLTNITIPASITSIGDSPFDNNSLTTVTVENPTPLAINANVFTGVTLANLTLNVPASGKTAYQAADVWKTFGTIVTPLEVGDQFTVGEFNYSITSVSPNEVEVQDSPNATGAVIIPATVDNNSTTYNVTSIGDRAFQSNQLASVSIPTSVSSIGYAAFENNELTSISIPEGLTSISGETFARNQLKNVIIPTGVTSIGFYAFGLNFLESVTIPESVTSIGSSAFQMNGITNVNIPASVTSIGSAAFDENKLTSIAIPASVTSIEEATFRGNAITSITMTSVTSIGEGAFAYNQLTSFNIPAIVTSIGIEAFANNALSSVNIPSGVTSIGNEAFAGNQLGSVTVENSTPITIGANVFEGSDLPKATLIVPGSAKAVYEAADVWKTFGTIVTPLEVGDEFTVNTLNYKVSTISPAAVEIQVSPSATGALVIPATVDNNGTTYSVTSIGIVAFRDNQLTSVIIPVGVTSIQSNAFEENQLTSVTIPDGVTSIGANAFDNNNLTRVTIPTGVTSIGSYAFNANELISVNIPAGITQIEDNTFTQNNLTSVNIPSSVTSIGNNAFEGNQLTSISLPVGLTSIGFGALKNNKLTSISIPSGISNIGSNTFSDNQLATITLPGSITSIDNSAFANNQLTSITIPATVTSIGENAFAGNQLTSVTAENPTPIDINLNVFDGSNLSMATLNVPAGVKEAYKAKIVWTSFGTTSSPPGASDVFNAGSYVYRISSITPATVAIEAGPGTVDVVIPEEIEHRGDMYSITSIDDFAFNDENDLALESVVIPASVVSIGKSAFGTDFTSITVKNSTPITISADVFEGLDFSKATLNVPAGTVAAYQAADVWKTFGTIVAPLAVGDLFTVETINYKITSISPAGVEVQDSPSATGVVVIPASVDNNGATYAVTSIGEDAFSENSLTSVTIPNGVTSIEEGAFEKNQLTSVSIPASVTSIKLDAFFTNQLTSVTIPAGVANIGGYAFGTNALTSVTIPSGVTSIDLGAFSDNKLTSISLPVGLTSISPEAFGNNQLTSVTVENPTPVAIDANVFQGSDLSKATLNTPASAKTAYQVADIWKTFGTIKSTGPAVGDLFSVGTINYKITSANPATVEVTDSPNTTGEVTIPATIDHRSITYSVTGIGAEAFKDNSLTSINISSNVTRIGEGAFENNQLTSINIPASMTSIEDRVFHTNLLTSVTIPEGVTSIGDRAFVQNKLTSIIIPGNVSTIKNSAFRANQLANVTISASVTSIADYAFSENPISIVTVENSTPVAINSGTFIFIDVGEKVSTSTVIGEKSTSVSKNDNYFSGKITTLADAILNVPTGAKAAYQAADVWKTFGSIIEFNVNTVVKSANANTLTEAELTSAGITQTDLTTDQIDVITIEITSSSSVPTTAAELQAIVDTAIAEESSINTVIASANANTLTEAELTAAGVTQTDLTTDRIAIITSQVVSADPTPNTTADLQVIVDAAIAEEAAVNDVITSATESTLTEEELTAAGVTQTDLTTNQIAIIISQVVSTDPVPNSTADLQTIVDAAIAEEAAVNVVVASAIAGTLTQEELTTAGITQTDLNSDQITRISANIVSADPAPNTTEDLQILIDEALTTDDSVVIVVASAKNNTLTEEELTAAGVLQTGFTTDQIVVITLHIVSADPEPVIKSELQEIVDAAIAEEAAVNIVVEASIIDALTASELTAAGITQTNLTTDQLAVISLRVFLSEPAPNTTAELQVIVEAAIEEEAVVNVVVAEAVEGALSQEALTAAGVTQTDLTEQQLEAITIEIVSFEPAPNTTLELQDLVDFVLSIILSTGHESNQENQKLVYPNPTSGILNFNLTNEQFSIEVYDVNGLLISTTPDISHAVNGVYFIRVTSEKGTQTRRIIKK